MDTNSATAIGEILRSLPEDRIQREVALQRLTDVCAGLEAASALRAAAARFREAAGWTGSPVESVAGRAVSDRPESTRTSKQHDLIADVLSAADTVLDGRGDPLQANGIGHALPAVTMAPALVTEIGSPAFLATVLAWLAELREIATTRPGTGACTVATAMQLWMWTMSHVQQWSDAKRREMATYELADVFCSLLAARCQILEVVQGVSRTSAHQGAGADDFISDLCHVQAAQSAAAVGGLCAELVFGYRRHPAWDADGCSACYQADDLDELEGLFPGIASSARGHSDVIEADGSHAPKAGPCAGFDGLAGFTRLRTRLDGCLTGVRLAKDRAARALPEMLAATTATSTR